MPQRDPGDPTTGLGKDKFVQMFLEDWPGGEIGLYFQYFLIFGSEAPGTLNITLSEYFSLFQSIFNDSEDFPLFPCVS